jgi:D-alanyl-lipoteichoic acid acyltransferase DltB (MBOAT superfamily)
MAFVPQYILILFFIIVIDYSTAIAIERSSGHTKKYWLVASLLSNILLLCFFKYFNFLNENLEILFSWIGMDFHRFNLDIILPIGLSFHTFQSMSYTIEVYKGRQKAERHIGYFANYVLFFPQMVAGPIERYETLGNELRAEHKPDYRNFSDGFRLILFGLFIKMAIADNIAPLVNEVYLEPLKFHSLEVFAAIILFSFQIYADFYGYSTIAVGCARLLGIRIMDNFKTPYLSRSVSEFWTRWHISLSTWFKDYLYIPLGGNRVKLLRWSANILIVFMVSGLWHGASWTFVIWGALDGIMLLLERYFSKIFKFKIKEEWSFFNILLCVKTFLVTSFIWVFFRAENFAKASDIFTALLQNNELSFSANFSYLPFVFTALLLLSDFFIYGSRFDKKLQSFFTPYRWAVYTVLIFCLFALSGTQKFAFIYFQF